MRSSRYGVRAAVVVAVMTLTACSSGSGTGGDEGGGGADDAQAAGLAFAKCMREHGVDVPDPEDQGDGMVQVGPGVAAGGPALKRFQEAQDQCKRHLADVGGSGPAGPLSEADKQRMVQFSACMREHGVDMPDPDFSGGGGAVTIPRGAGEDQEFQAAQEACQHLFGPAGGVR